MIELERLLKSLANKRRLAIVKYLKSHKEATVGELAGAIKLSFRSTSKHLAVLSSSGVANKERRRLQVFYYLTPEPTRALRTIINLV